MVRGVVLELARLDRPRPRRLDRRRGRLPLDDGRPHRPRDQARGHRARSPRSPAGLDLSPVMHEPFRQWVVEDRFVGGARPDLGAVGVQLVEDVTPFELMKLRMLNGTHSSLAYLGYLAGHETIADTVADPAFAGFVPPPLARRDHPDAARRRRARISAATPTRCSRATPTRRSGTAPGRSPWTAAEAAAAHPRHPRRQPRRRPPLPRPDARRRRPGCATSAASTSAGRAIDVRDPLAARLKALADRRRPARRPRSRRCSASAEIFPRDARRRARPSATAVAAAYAGLLADGARAAVARVAG